jgi:PIN domain nuclease of toxin-antitoxin system
LESGLPEDHPEWRHNHRGKRREHLTLVKPVLGFVRVHGLIELPISIHHGKAVRSLPLHHKDSFDRILVAQAKAEGLALATADRRLSWYGIPVLQVQARAILSIT